MGTKSIEEIEKTIAALPKGNITYKTIRGIKRMYLQWSVDGKKKSRYVKKEDEASIIDLVEKRKTLEEEIRTIKNSMMFSNSGLSAV